MYSIKKMARDINRVVYNNSRNDLIHEIEKMLSRELPLINDLHDFPLPYEDALLEMVESWKQEDSWYGISDSSYARYIPFSGNEIPEKLFEDVEL